MKPSYKLNAFYIVIITELAIAKKEGFWAMWNAQEDI
jgi:hypothetical protein